MTNINNQAMQKYASHAAMLIPQNRNINHHSKERNKIAAIIKNYDVANLTSWHAKEILANTAKQGFNINPHLSDIFHQCGIHFGCLLQLAELEQIKNKQATLRKKYRKSILPSHFIHQYQAA